MEKTFIIIKDRYKKVYIDVNDVDMSLKSLFDDLIIPAVKALGYHGVENFLKEEYMI